MRGVCFRLTSGSNHFVQDEKYGACNSNLSVLGVRILLRLDGAFVIRLVIMITVTPVSLLSHNGSVLGKVSHLDDGLYDDSVAKM
jgi:hypothetical protein